MCEPVVEAIVLLIGVSTLLVGAKIRAQVMEDVCSGMQVSKNSRNLPHKNSLPCFFCQGLSRAYSVAKWTLKLFGGLVHHGRGWYSHSIAPGLIGHGEDGS